MGVQFVTLGVTQRFCDFRWTGVRLRPPFRPSASDFDKAKVTSHSVPSVPLWLKSALLGLSPLLNRLTRR
ncbi:hypothetical protein EZZ79_17115 [Pseudomonas syringae]|nr:hypothetical protein [Pseudomonas syringae]UZA80601.1 hypothetical protein EZZ79_17115 [Pseudomonas syringae]